MIWGMRLGLTEFGTESQYNVIQHTNPREMMRTYEFTTDVTVYYGKVKDGTGYQILFPDDLDVTPGDVLKYIEEGPLK